MSLMDDILNWGIPVTVLANIHYTDLVYARKECDYCHINCLFILFIVDFDFNMVYLGCVCEHD